MTLGIIFFLLKKEWQALFYLWRLRLGATNGSTKHKNRYKVALGSAVCFVGVITFTFFAKHTTYSRVEDIEMDMFPSSAVLSFQTKKCSIAISFFSRKSLSIAKRIPKQNYDFCERDPG